MTLKIKFFLLFFVFLNLIFCLKSTIFLLPKEKILFHGSYNLLSFGMKPKKEFQSKRVVLLGNSVFQATTLVKEIEDYCKDKATCKRFNIGNFSQTGTSVADLIFSVRHISKFNPDLTIVHISPVSFGYNWPIYRTDSYKALGLPSFINLLRENSIQSTLRKEDISEILFYSYFYPYRFIKIIRAKFKTTFPKTMNLFPYLLNKAMEWKVSKPQNQMATVKMTQYPNAEKLFITLLNELNKNTKKSLVIIQENDYEDNPIIKKLSSFIDGYENVSYINYKNYYNKELFSDSIHPSIKGAKLIAPRYGKLINENLSP